MRPWPPTQLNQSAITAWLLSAILSLISGCGKVDPVTEAGAQTSLRIRSDFEADLNADEGWAATPNESVTIQADQPFRLRFEVEPSNTLEDRSFRLQYRRNGGEWIPVEAHDFPHPLRELDLSFEATPTAEKPKDWWIDADNTGTAVIKEKDNSKWLNVEAGPNALRSFHPLVLA